MYKTICVSKTNIIFPRHKKLYYLVNSLLILPLKITEDIIILLYRALLYHYQLNMSEFSIRECDTIKKIYPERGTKTVCKMSNMYKNINLSANLDWKRMQVKNGIHIYNYNFKERKYRYLVFVKLIAHGMMNIFQKIWICFAYIRDICHNDEWGNGNKKISDKLSIYEKVV